MTTAFYGQRVMSSSSLAAAVDPEIEIKYLPIATTSRFFIPHSAEPTLEWKLLRVRELWFIEKENGNGKVSMIETTRIKKKLLEQKEMILLLGRISCRISPSIFYNLKTVTVFLLKQSRIILESVI